MRGGIGIGKLACPSVDGEDLAALNSRRVVERTAVGSAVVHRGVALDNLTHLQKPRRDIAGWIFDLIAPPLLLLRGQPEPY